MRLAAAAGVARLRRGLRAAAAALLPAPAGRFQVSTHTLPDRYPWLFGYAAQTIADGRGVRLLSFGCSRGEELLALRRRFPRAQLRGLDIDPVSIAAARLRGALAGADLSCAVAADTRAEPAAAYDAIFCLAVLVHGTLTARQALCSEPLLYFADFERQVGDFHRCLKDGGYLFLHTTNFRLCDTALAERFEVALTATPEQMAPDIKFGPDNRRLPDQYYAVGFRKRSP